MTDYGLFGIWSGICFIGGAGVHFAVARVLRRGSIDMEAVQKAQIDRLTRVVEKYRKQTSHQNASIQMHEAANTELQRIANEYKAKYETVTEERDILKARVPARRGEIEAAVREYMAIVAITRNEINLMARNLGYSVKSVRAAFDKIEGERLASKIGRGNAHVA